MGHMQEWKINTDYPWINIKIYTPTLTFLYYSCHVPVDDDSLVLSLTKRNSCFPLAIIMARRDGMIDCCIAAWLVYSCTYSKSKRRDV